MSSRIAKNTLALYTRMIVIVIISLYSSRVIINALGENNYGIFVVVAGVTSMLSFLNTTMSGAISRFINYDIGIGNVKKIAKRYSSSLMIQSGIALIFLILSETIGLWFLNNKLVIAPDRIFAANCIYQFSILTAVISIIQVPFTALVLAYERMGVYSSIEIVSAILKLGCALAIMFDKGDRLILYGFLLFVAHLINFIAYFIFSIKTFKSCKFRWHSDWHNIKPMLKFSGWDLYGNIAYTSMLQGATILINMFFGAVVNAAGGITMTVSSQVAWLGRNITLAYRPQIITSYAQNNYHNMCILMSECAKLSLLFVLLGTVPLYMNIDYILHLWLGVVPEYTSTFCKIMLIAGCINTVNSVLTNGIHASGNISRLSVGTGTLYLLTVPTTYILFKVGFSPKTAYMVMLVAHVLALLLNSVLLKREIPEFSQMKFFFESIFKCMITAGPAVAIIAFLFPSLGNGLVRCVTSSLLFIILFTPLAFAYILTTSQKKYLLSRIKIH